MIATRKGSDLIAAINTALSKLQKISEKYLATDVSVAK